MSYEDVVASQRPCGGCGRPVVAKRRGLGYTHLYAKDAKRCKSPGAGGLLRGF